MLADVSGHAFELPLQFLKLRIGCQLLGGSGLFDALCSAALTLNYIPRSRRGKTPRNRAMQYRVRLPIFSLETSEAVPSSVLSVTADVLLAVSRG
jgi:hypothetical protein